MHERILRVQGQIKLFSLSVYGFTQKDNMISKFEIIGGKFASYVNTNTIRQNNIKNDKLSLLDWT